MLNRRSVQGSSGDRERCRCQVVDGGCGTAEEQRRNDRRAEEWRPWTGQATRRFWGTALGGEPLHGRGACRGVALGGALRLLDGAKAPCGQVDVVLFSVEAEEVAIELEGGDAGGAGTAEGVEDARAGVRVGEEDPL